MPLDSLEARWAKQAYRARLAQAGLTTRGTPPKPKRVRKPKVLQRDKPYMACDGEGYGKDRKTKQQNYMLLRIGPRELYTGKRLTTLECLEFICQAPRDHILIGFGFTYDGSQILRDLPAERLRNGRTGVFDGDKPKGKGHSPYTYFEDYGVEWRPRHYLKVCRLSRTIGPDGKPRCKAIPGSTRVIRDTLAFFQCSFERVLKTYGIGRGHWRHIAEGKKNRNKVTRMSKRLRRYCELECEFLAEVMEHFRRLTYEYTPFRPATWDGPGKLAASAHKLFDTITAKELAALVPADVLKMSSAAYYGGRFEITRVGRLMGTVHSYDIRSAYPDAMRHLPCLRCGKWKRIGPKQIAALPPDALFVAETHFKHPPDTFICGLPIRQKSGAICWPIEGNGVYWSPEIRSAERLGAVIEYGRGWRYIKRCDHPCFDWVPEMYEARRTLDSDPKFKNRGVAIKLAINSGYGKLAQRIGNGPWANLIHASLITALTRARLNDVAGQNPQAIIMFATDGILSRSPLNLPIGKALGEWEEKRLSQVFIMQPGLYWGDVVSDRRKLRRTRGVSVRRFRPFIPRIEKAWSRYIEHPPYGYPPQVTISIEAFTGLKLASARNKLETACVWSPLERTYSFAWTNKRADAIAINPTDHLVEFIGGTRAFILSARPGGPDLISLPHKGDMDDAGDMLTHGSDWEAMPDPHAMTEADWPE